MRFKRLEVFSATMVLGVSSLLTLAIPLAHAAVQTCTWTGAGATANFSDVANWSSCGAAAPLSGDNLVFPFSNAAGFTANNDLTGASFNSLVFSGAVNSTADSYIISGNGLAITGSVSNSGTGTSVLNGPLAQLDVPLTLASNVTSSVSSLYGLLAFSKPVSGAGNLTFSGNGGLILEGDNTPYTGSIVVNSGTLFASSPNALGTASAPGATVNNGADIDLLSCTDVVLNGNITLTGSSSIITGDYPNPKLGSFAGACFTGGSSGAVEVFGESASTAMATFNGHLTLGSDITFAGINAITTVNGALSGAFKIAMLSGYTGKLVINSSANTSSTPNGTYTSLPFTKTLSDSLPSNIVDIFGNNAITIDGTRGLVDVNEGGILYGTGILGFLTVDSKSTVAPGHSPGCMTVSSLSLDGTYQAQIGGVDPCTGYDQIKVLSGGSVTLTNAILELQLYSGFVPKIGQSYTIIDNQSAATSPVTGTFQGLAEGATLVKNGITYSVTYKGGDGNDVVITVKSVGTIAAPAKPNTGFKLASSQPLTAFSVSVLAAGALLLAARKVRATVK